MLPLKQSDVCIRRENCTWRLNYSTALIQMMASWRGNFAWRSIYVTQVNIMTASGERLRQAPPHEEKAEWLAVTDIYVSWSKTWVRLNLLSCISHNNIVLSFNFFFFRPNWSFLLFWVDNTSRRLLANLPLINLTCDGVLAIRFEKAYLCFRFLIKYQMYIKYHSKYVHINI